MKQGQSQVPKRPGEGKAPRTMVSIPPRAKECFEYMAYLRGMSLSAWLYDAARAAALEQGGDPDVGAP